MAWFRGRSRLPPRAPSPAAGGEPIALVVVEGSDQGKRLVVASPEVEIGRGSATGVADGRLTLHDRSVSTHQARLFRDGDAWWIEHDAAAANPTLVNGVAVQRKPLKSGDRVRLGRVLLEARAAAPARAERTEVISLGLATTVQIQPPREIWGYVRVLRGPQSALHARLPLFGDAVAIGRAPECDIVLADPGVSRRHAELVRENGRVVLVHRSRTNPTLRNGASVHERAVLGDGDEIRLAENAVLRLELDAGASASGSRALAARGLGLRDVMAARVDLEARVEREFVRDGTFLDVDVADSYGLKTSDGRAERVFVSFERFRGYVDARVAEHGGRVLNSNGDEVMAFFDSADAAVGCARALLAGLRVWNARESLLEREFRVRIGIHTGRSAVDLANGVAYSPVLDVAGHLQKQAPVGGVLISDATFAALADSTQGFTRGAPLARESLDTWVLAPEAAGR